MRIKKLVLTAVAALAVASLIAFVVSERFQPPEPPPQPDPLPDALIVFCFHGNERSEKSKNMEAYTREVLEASFADLLENKTVVWQVLNYEDPENAHLKTDFNIVAPCIVVGDARSSRLGTAKNLVKKCAELIDDKEAFTDYVRAEIAKSLE